MILCNFPIAFKQENDKIKQKVEGILILKNSEVEFVNQNHKVCTRFFFSDIKSIETNSLAQKVRITFIQNIRKNITLIGLNALRNLKLMLQLSKIEIKKFINHKRKSNTQSELLIARKRSRILVDNDIIQKLYYEFVIKHKILSNKLFWKDQEAVSGIITTKNTLISNDINANEISIKKKINIAKIKNRILTLNKLKTSNCILSQEQVHLIFSSLPHVKNAYFSVVPTKLTKNMFWKDFFQSKHHCDSDFIMNSPKTEIDELLEMYLKILRNEKIMVHSCLNLQLDETSGNNVLYGREYLQNLENINNSSLSVIDQIQQTKKIIQAKSDVLIEKKRSFHNVRYPFSRYKYKKIFLVRMATTINFKHVSKLLKKTSECSKNLATLFPLKKESSVINYSSTQVFSNILKEIKQKKINSLKNKVAVFSIDVNDQQQMIDYYIQVSELVRHFWSYMLLGKQMILKKVKIYMKLYEKQVKKQLSLKNGRLLKFWKSINLMLVRTFGKNIKNN